jgi:uncharacterized OsmC-like protein
MVQAAEQSAIRNGVNTEQLFGTLDVVKQNPELGAFTFRASNKWIDGSHNRSQIQNFFGAGQEQVREQPFILDAGEPAVLVGDDEGPNPAEYLTHAIAACLTTSIVNIAAARRVKLNSVESQVEGDIDLRGAMAIDEDVPNGYQEIRVGFRIDADAPRERVQEIVERAQARSAVFATLTQGVAVNVNLED